MGKPLSEKERGAIEANPRFELRYGKWGAYFHDTQRGGRNGSDMPLDEVLEKLNRLELYTQRLAAANKGRTRTF